ncbi:MAG: DUF6985 domain-containing protein [Capsulimonadaceae bacterium]
MESSAFPQIEMEPFPTLTWDGYIWSGEIVLPAFADFAASLGPHDNEGRPAGTATLHIKTFDDEPSLPIAEQVKAYRDFLDRQASIREAVVTALFEQYPALQQAFADDAPVFMPDICEASELKAMLGMPTVHILPVAREGIAYVGLQLECAWDLEHGVGVMLYRDRILEIGYAETAFREWIAEQDETD